MRTVYAYVKCLKTVTAKGGKKSESMMEEREHMF